MSISRNYDTVAFDVRDNATMLLFARTTATGEIDDYVLLMRPDGQDLDDSVYIEVNEDYAGQDMIREARLTGNVLTLALREPASELGGATEIVLTYDDTPQNHARVETGVFHVLGDTLMGGVA